MSTWQVWPPDDGREHSVTGRILHRSGLAAPTLGNTRDLWVCLPPGYDSSSMRYPVLYMQDGQNLFDRAIGFSGQEWHIDETLAAHAGRADAIVVGIANTGVHRLEEYSPFRDSRMGGGKGELYLDFVVDVVKPLIDLSFRTLPGRGETYIGGSSMGALIALHAFLTRAHVFGGAAALSPALWFAQRATFDVVAASPFTDGRVYIDIGTREGPVQLLDVARLRNRMVHKGYRKGENLLVVVEGGGRHNEAAWARRFPRALRFLVGREEEAEKRRRPGRRKREPKRNK
jgi:predicted alpha/beta superfamily hydrolase